MTSTTAALQRPAATSPLTALLRELFQVTPLYILLSALNTTQR